MGLTFDHAAGTYVEQQLCLTDQTSADDEIISGLADFSEPGKVTLTPKKTSCPSKNPTGGWANYMATSTQLTLTSSAGVYVYGKVASGGGMAPSGSSIRFGCWIDGVFTPHDITDL